MTIKEEENALRFLLRFDKNEDNPDNKSISEILFERLGPNTIAVLNVLKDDGLINFSYLSKDIRGIRITSEGLKYFDAKKQAKIEYWKQLAISHIWNIIESAIVSFITALIALKLSGK